MLKSVIHLHGTNAIDYIWYTCCALHNMLLEVDGLDQPWDRVTALTSSWECQLVELVTEDIPTALCWLLYPVTIRNYETS
jgi:hypothetical protein